MDFHKIMGEKIFSGHTFFPEKSVLIANKKGVIEAIIPEEDAGEDVQHFKGIICPGLINCHCHLELSHLKGLVPENTGLVDFVIEVVNNRHFSSGLIQHAIENAEKEMLANGIVAVGDICNNVLTYTTKSKSTLHFYNFIELSGWLPAIAPTRWQHGLQLYEQFKLTGPSSIVPHAAYSVSTELWQWLQPSFGRKTISIHNQETPFEDELFTNKSGDFLRMFELMKLDTSFFVPTRKSSLQSYFDKLKEAEKIILVHNTFTTPNDLAYIAESEKFLNTFFCLCVNANEYIEKAFPPVNLLRQNNCNIVLGTDSMASNRQLDLIEEMKTIQRQLPEISLQEMLSWATINGARALQFDERLGSLEPGKCPGIVLIDGLENFQLTPRTKAHRIL